MTINSPPPFSWPCMWPRPRSRASPWPGRGTTQNDILKEYIARGTYIFRRDFDAVVTDIFESVPTSCRAGTPSASAATTCASRSHGGAGAGFHPRRRHRLRRAAISRGWTSMTSRIASASSSPRGASCSRKWQVPRRPPDVGRIVKERFGAPALAPWPAATTSRPRLVAHAQSIDNNVVRTTVQPWRRFGRGSEPAHQLPRRSLALPTARPRRLALRTQQILAYESGVTETPDRSPAATTSSR